MGEEKIQLETLVKRLFIIDSKLTSENAQLVSEYNQIVEEIYAAISKIRTDNEKSIVLSRKKMRWEIMEIVKTLQEIVNELDSIDTYDEGIAGRLSEIDQKIQDLLHYIENNKISILWSYKYMVELKKLRVERRQIKNDMYLLSKFNEHKNKIISSGNRQFLMR